MCYDYMWFLKDDCSWHTMYMSISLLTKGTGSYQLTGFVLEFNGIFDLLYYINTQKVMKLKKIVDCCRFRFNKIFNTKIY